MTPKRARPVSSSDLQAIADLLESPGATSPGPRTAVFTYPYHTLMSVRSCHNAYPDGAFLCEAEEGFISYVNAIRLPGHVVLTSHRWEVVTVRGTGVSHRPDGGWLYACRLLYTAGPGHWPLIEEGPPSFTALVSLAEKTGTAGVAMAVRFPGLRDCSGRTEFQRQCIEERDPKVCSGMTPIGWMLQEGFAHHCALPNYLGTANHFALMVWTRDTGYG